MDENKRSVYQNKQEFKNTLDNLGRYKIVEKKAPKGCILTKQEWTFELSENTDNKEHQKSAYGNDRSKPGNSCGLGGNSIRTT